MTATAVQAPNGGAKMSPLFALGARYQIDPGKLLGVLRNTVIRPTDKHTPTDEEVAAFCVVANQYQLNPFTREIHAFADRGGVVPVIGMDGWVTLVNRHEDYDGCEFEEHHDAEGRLHATTCTMYHRRRSKPVKVTEWLSECRRNSTPWTTMPHRMLRHKAYCQAARLAFGLAGVYDEDEARDILANRGPLPEIQETASAEKTTRTKRVSDKLKTPIPPEPPQDDLSAFVARCHERIAAAETTGQLEEIGADMVAQQPELEAAGHFRQLAEQYQAKYRSITGE